MFRHRITHRIAAAALAVALALAGAVGVGAPGANDHHETPGTEQAGGTWSYTGSGDSTGPNPKGPTTNYGSTWS